MIRHIIKYLCPHCKNVLTFRTTLAQTKIPIANGNGMSEVAHGPQVTQWISIGTMKINIKYMYLPSCHGVSGHGRLKLKWGE